MDEGFHYYVVFGAAVRPGGQPRPTLRRRVEGAFRLAEGRSRVRFLVTGGLGRHPPAECEVMRDLLIGFGVAPEAIVTEGKGHNTLSSAVRCARILTARGDAAGITVCSSSYHIPRCWLLLRVLGVPARKAPFESDRSWLGFGRWLRASLREVVAVPWDVALAAKIRFTRSPTDQCLHGG